ncbi:hypothetical protein GCK72_000835 [Caenorhabditis remanei]|uniref:PWWP domain-containing protein n=1 Tax=Caenorhabditis remanei TaxID=31234 RepID=A0A6A5HTA5_CAERE|nr:hypothetical protein GCK72_000835 [Caenorhabditis remanei]KAF1769022.1 hypothetical protein GCK72_000835 [Caenorhabditis remanei]
MDSTEPSCSSHNFQPNDLIWAKMKGFPPWPAKVLERSEDTPARRIPVMFFGTLETSFMKPTDLSDYLSNQSIHEIPRKQKDFNKAVQEIRKAAGLQTDSDEINFPTIERKSPPSSPTSGRKRQTSGRFLDAIMAGPDPSKMRGQRSGSASTKTRSRASSNASASKFLRDMMRKERHRMNSESSHGSKKKLLSNALLGGAPSTSEAFPDYADSTDFNALFGEAIFGNFELNDDAKSWKSRRSRNSSKVFDFDLLGRSRNRSGSASGRRSRMISLSGFSGVSDMFDEIFNNPGDLESHADQLMLTLNNMPSDGSIDRPLSPEMLNLNPMLQPAVEFCDTCGFECRIVNGIWKCLAAHCGVIKTQGGATMNAVREMLDEPLRIPKLEIKTECLSDNSAEKVNLLPAKRARKPKRNSDDDDSDDEEASRRKALMLKKKKRVQVLSPRSRTTSPVPQNISTSSGLLGRSNSPTSSSLRIRDRARPKHYKVEKTPPISESGHRHCVNCNGQVRPQMCGGNRHRWRCVDKKCRKWYGWVRSHEEIPKNTGRKKMATFKSPITKPMKPLKPKKEEDEDTYPLKRKVGRPSKNDIKIRLRVQKEMEEKQAAANAARAAEMATNASVAAANADSTTPQQQQRRKYTKRKKDGLGGVTGSKRDFSPFDEDVKNRPTSPLSDLAASYRPSAMEKRARWWTGEKRRVDASPERDLGVTPADSAAAFRMISQATRAAAVTRADEVGTINGSLDLLMDSLLGSMGPLLATLTQLPAFREDNPLALQFMNASAVHIPTFQ